MTHYLIHFGFLELQRPEAGVFWEAALGSLYLKGCAQKGWFSPLADVCLVTHLTDILLQKSFVIRCAGRILSPVSVTHCIPIKYNRETCNGWTLFSNELHWLLQHDEYHMLHLVCASRTPPSSPKPPRHHANKPQENSASPTVSQLHAHHAFLLVSSAAHFLSSPSSLL